MAVEATTQNAMTRFVAKARDLFAEEPDLDERWELLRPVLADLLADPEVQEAAKTWPDCVAKGAERRTCCSTRTRTTAS